jgi:hypothetical protein
LSDALPGQPPFCANAGAPQSNARMPTAITADRRIARFSPSGLALEPAMICHMFASKNGSSLA